MHSVGGGYSSVARAGGVSGWISMPDPAMEWFGKQWPSHSPHHEFHFGLLFVRNWPDGWTPAFCLMIHMRKPVAVRVA